MAFDNSAVFPLEARAERITPVWSTTVAQMGGGATVRNQWWSDTLHTIEIDLGTITLANFEILKKHFNGRRGRTRGFPYLSRSRYTSSTEAFGTGDGSTAAFQLKINDGDASNAYNREIYKIVALSETIFVAGTPKTRTTHYTIDNNTGIVTFTGGNIPTAGQALTWSGNFYVPVRYDMDSIEDAELHTWTGASGVQLVNVSGIRMVETRDIA